MPFDEGKFIGHDFQEILQDSRIAIKKPLKNYVEEIRKISSISTHLKALLKPLTGLFLSVDRPGILS